MKKLFALMLVLAFAANAKAQIQWTDINSSNTWLKAGINIGVPVADLADRADLALGAELSAQFLQTKANGIGVKAGYTHYLGADPLDDFSAIPLAVFWRFYPESTGLFAGVEVGYAFINKLALTEGGTYGRPHIGWHTNNWNFLLFYETILQEDPLYDFQSVGLAATYNLRFGK